ncbi:MAG: DNA-binding protein YbaB [Salibacteraceae bacterium]|jgi:DNA-binding protein YbaB
MFGDLKNQLNKGKEDLAKRMVDTYVRSISPSTHIEVIANGNKQIMDIRINDEIYADKEQLEDELITTLNNALEKAEEMFQEEMKTVMKSNMPDIPGLDGLLD